MSAQSNASKIHLRIRTKKFDKEEVMVLYDAPGEMNQEAIGASIQSTGFSNTRLSRMGWNPGKPHGAVWRITGTRLMGRTGYILHDEEQDIIMTIISLGEYQQEIKAGFNKPPTSGKGKGRSTYARATVHSLLPQ